MEIWDTVIVGSGLAGLRAAVALAPSKVAVLSRVHPLRSHTPALLSELRHFYRAAPDQKLNAA